MTDISCFGLSTPLLWTLTSTWIKGNRSYEAQYSQCDRYINSLWFCTVFLQGMFQCKLQYLGGKDLSIHTCRDLRQLQINEQGDWIEFWRRQRQSRSAHVPSRYTGEMLTVPFPFLEIPEDEPPGFFVVIAPTKIIIVNRSTQRFHLIQAPEKCTPGNVESLGQGKSAARHPEPNQLVDP